MAALGLSRTNSSSALTEEYGATFKTMGRTAFPRTKADPLWRTHDLKAQKSGQRGTIYWVGKSIMGEDSSATGQRSKGASYHGEWGDNRKHGYGVQVFPSGEKYEGQWSNGQRNGEGTYWVPVGKAQRLRKVYVGGWKDDRRHGRGTCFFKNGEFFQGYWDQGKMQGHGTLRYGDGDLYVGEFHEGKRSGKGTLNKANGDCYEGYWLNDKREGSGSFFYAASGKVFVGEWASDLPKAGVFSQASANPEQAGAVPTTTTLPPLRLALPTEVLQGALMAVRSARKNFRVKLSPLDQLFSDGEISSLRAAFESAERPDGTAGPLELQALCSHLGTEMPMERLRSLLISAGFLPANCEFQAEAGVSLVFDEFMRVIAVLLDEEASVEQCASPNMSHSHVEEFDDQYLFESTR